MSNEINKFLEQLPNENKNQYNTFLAYVESNESSIEEWYNKSNIKFKLKTIYNWSSDYNWTERITNYKNYVTVTDIVERQYNISSSYNDLTANITDVSTKLFGLLNDTIDSAEPSTSDIKNIIGSISELTKLNRLINNMSEANIAVATQLKEENEEEYGFNDVMNYINSLPEQKED